MAALGLQAYGTKILRNGKPWRHVGVNHFALFMRELYDFGYPHGTLEGDLDMLKSRGIELVRVGFGWFSYQTWLDLYWLNQAQYWATVKRVLDAFAARNMLCLVNMGWGLLGFTQLTYYTTGATIPPIKLADRTSPLNAMWRAYVTEWATRFGNHPAVGMVQIGNENSAKLGNEYHPSWAMDGSYNTLLKLGPKPEGGYYTAAEKMSYAAQVSFDEQFVSLWHSLDPHGRIVCSGNAQGNGFGVAQRRTANLTADTLADWSGRPDTGGKPWVAHREQAYDVIETHTYPLAADTTKGQFYGDGVKTYRQHIQLHKQWADAAGKPLLLAEFGVCESGSPVDTVSCPTGKPADGSPVVARALWSEVMTAVEDFDVPIALGWNVDGVALPPVVNGSGFPTAPEWQLWSMTDPSRTYMLDSIQALNARRS